MFQVMFLTLCGGLTPKDNIRRGLQKLFEDKLATKCSWTGRKNNYELRNLKVIELLKGNYFLLLKIIYVTVKAANQ